VYTEIVREYLRECKLPTIWCPGCGHGIVLGAVLRAVHRAGWNKNDTVLISGIGCAGRAPGYVDFNTLHTTHGRALTFATGIKLANPKLKVIVVMGDGDAAAIGGNHFIHAARRNIDITAIVFNNAIYGMTGGQYSPTTPFGAYASTTPFGNVEYDFDICELMKASGATFIARSVVSNPRQIENFVYKGLLHKGFSVIDVLTTCPTGYGRRNKLTDDGVKNIEYARSRVIPIEEWQNMSPEERRGRFPVGIFRDLEGRSEYTENYEQKIIPRAQNMGCEK